jgi:hypothetical protein
MCEVGDRANEKPARESDKSGEDLEEYEEHPYDDEERAHRMYVWILPQYIHHCGAMLINR